VSKVEWGNGKMARVKMLLPDCQFSISPPPCSPFYLDNPPHQMKIATNKQINLENRVAGAEKI